LLNTKTTPLDYVITQDFLSSLTEHEQTILEDLSAGFTIKEIRGITTSTIPTLNQFAKTSHQKHWNILYDTEKGREPFF
jgi:hypothetical protein